MGVDLFGGNPPLLKHLFELIISLLDLFLPEYRSFRRLHPPPNRGLERFVPHFFQLFPPLGVNSLHDFIKPTAEPDCKAFSSFFLVR